MNFNHIQSNYFLALLKLNVLFIVWTPPDVVYGNLCNIYKTEWSEDKLVEVNPTGVENCFELQVYKSYGPLPETDDRRNSLRPVLIQMQGNPRCDNYYVHEVEFIIVGYTVSNKSDLQPVGTFDLNTAIKEYDSSKQCEELSDFIDASHVSIDGCNGLGTRSKLFNGKIPSSSFIKDTFQPDWQPHEGCSVEWSYFLDPITNYPSGAFTIDIMSSISYDNKVTKDEGESPQRKKIVGLMDIDFSFIANGSMSTPPICPDQLNAGRKKNYIRTSEFNPLFNLCRCMDFKEGNSTTASKILTNEKVVTLPNCFSLTISDANNQPGSKCLVLQQRPGCTTTIEEIEDVFFSAVNNLQYPFGSFRPVQKKFICPGLDSIFANTGIDFHNWRSQSCFDDPSKNRKALFSQDDVPSILRMGSYWKGFRSRTFAALFVFRPNAPTLPSMVQFQAHALVKGRTSAGRNFKQLISKTKNAVFESGDLIVDESTADPPKIPLNEDYHDDIYVEKKDDNSIATTECSTLTNRSDHLCQCFMQLRGPSPIQELHTLVQTHQAEWAGCFQMFVTYRQGTLPTDPGLHQAVVGVVNNCPNKFEVLEVAIEALSYDGLPFGYSWTDINVKRNPNDPTTTYCLDFKRRLPSNRAEFILRETWGAFEQTCSPLPVELYRSHLQDAVNPIKFFHSNRPLVGYQKGSSATQNNSYGVCGVWGWKRGSSQQEYFEMQFLAQVVVEDFVKGTNIPIVIRSDKYSATYQLSTNSYIWRLLSPSNLRVDIDLNQEYYDTIINQQDNDCLAMPDSFDHLDDELCLCFFDHPDRGLPRPEDIDATLEMQSRTDINVSSTTREFRVSVQIAIDPGMDVTYGLHEMALQVMVKLNDDTQLGVPIGRWNRAVDKSRGSACGDELDGIITTPDCPYGPQSSSLLAAVSSHTSNLPPNIFHFQNPWKDNYFRLCVVWEYLPASSPRSVEVKDLEFQVYAQLRYFNRMKPGLYYSSADHGLENFRFSEDGRSLSVYKIQPSMHDEDFRVHLHPSINAEKKTDCSNNATSVPLPQLPLFDSFTCLRFHPFNFVRRVDMDDEDDPFQNDAKGCFTLDVFPYISPYHLHIRFRQHDLVSRSDCSDFMASEVFLIALDQDGDPVGNSYDTFRIYDDIHHESVESFSSCTDEDVIVNRTGPFLGDENGVKDKHPCAKYERVKGSQNNFFFQVNPEEYPYHPTVHHATFINQNSSLGGLCFIWLLKPSEYPQNKDLKEIQFIAEIFVPQGDWSDESWRNRPNSRGTVYILRSLKYKYNPDAGSQLVTPPNCHDETISPPHLEEIPRSNLSSNAYNIRINGDQFRACKLKYTEACFIDTHYPEPVPVTNPPSEVIGTTAPPLIGPTRDPFTMRPEKAFYGCLTIKGCISPETLGVKDYEPNCIETLNCKHLIAYGKEEEGVDGLLDDEVSIELYAQTNGWIAIGLSRDKRMGDDYVVECVRNSLPFGRPSTFESWNSIQQNKLLIVNPRQNESNIRLIETVQSQVSIYCKFYIKKVFVIKDPFNGKSHTFDLSKDKFCILMAWSNKLEQMNKIGGHEKSYRGDALPCKKTLSLTRKFVPSSTQVVFFQVHGVLMTFAWVFCISLGNFIGRYFRTAYERESIFGMKLWLVLHIGFNLMALVSIVIALFFNFFGSAGWTSVLGPANFHRYVGGLLVLGNFAINVILGAFMRPRNYDEMNVSTRVHLFLGHFSHGSSCIIIAEVHKIPFSSVSCTTGYMGVAWLIVHVVSCVVMAYSKFWIHLIGPETDDTTVRPSRADLLGDFTPSIVRESWEQEDVVEASKWLKLGRRTKVLIAYGVMAFLFFLTISGMLIWPPRGPCYMGEDHDTFDEFPPYDDDSLEETN